MSRLDDIVEEHVQVMYGNMTAADHRAEVKRLFKDLMLELPKKFIRSGEADDGTEYTYFDEDGFEQAVQEL